MARAVPKILGLGVSAALTAAAVLVLVVTACVDAPRHDFPSEYPLAASSLPCPNLTGTFENAGTPLKTRYGVPTGPLSLTTLIMAPGTVPSGKQVSALRIFGPYQGQLQIEALSADGIVARASMPGGPQEDGFAHSKPFSRFFCAWNNIIIYGEPISTTEVAVRMYRGVDGSLVLAQEHIHAGAVFVDVSARRWFRFQQLPAQASPAMQ